MPKTIGGKKTGWQQSGVLTTGRPDKRVSMQADFQPEAGYYTIQFGVDAPEATVPSYDAIAEITWSVEGATIRRVVSVANGVTVSGPGQAVRVVVYDQSLNASIFGYNDYTVTIAVSPGTRPSAGRPPILQARWTSGLPSVAPIAIAGSATLDIPQDSGVGSVELLLSAVAGIFPIIARVQHFVPGGTIQKLYMITEETDGFIAIAPGSTQVTVYNESVSAIYCTATWGIDG